ncbi:hypothetical protein KIT90_12535 [Vibrio sp. B172a]|uniref:hypothetical protein n=1 Tax=Vibrio sp. B172a TaxID=2835790 RepID=UPI00255364F1|nr:hypothetical protein [Vibrio sp. B172a]MDK9782208.1 hypothetical protein [Vibrio sp. B172a]
MTFIEVKKIPYSHQERVKELNNIFHKENIPIQIISIEYLTEKPNSLSHARVALVCNYHGVTLDFDNPYTPTFDNLKKKTSNKKNKFNGCNKCSGKYHRTEKETVELLQSSLANKKAAFVRFYGMDVGCKGKFIYKCLQCNNLSDPVSINAGINGKAGCKKCTLEKIWKPKLAIGEDVKLFLDSRFGEKKFHWLIDLKKNYKGDDLVSGICLKHQKMVTKKLRSLRHRFTYSPCQKCSEEHKVEKMTLEFEEQENRIKNALADRPWIKYKLEHVDRGNETRIELYCTMHCYPFSAKISNVVHGKANCKLCGNNTHHLSQIMRQSSVDFLRKRQTLYSLEFVNNKTQQSWYKIGVTANNIQGRYSPKQLRMDDLSIKTVILNFQTDVFTASLTELFLLCDLRTNTYRIDKTKYMKNVGGGTECFRKSILNIDNVSTLINSAYASYEKLLTYALKDEELKSALNIANDYFKNSETSSNKIYKLITIRKLGKLRKAPDGMSEKSLLNIVIDNNYDKRETAKSLGITITTLNNWLRRFNLTEQVKMGESKLK